MTELHFNGPPFPAVCLGTETAKGEAGFRDTGELPYLHRDRRGGNVVTRLSEQYC